MSPYYKYLIDGGYDLKILIYSGDADSVCATSGTQTWMYDLGYEVVDEWKPWTVDKQVSGTYPAAAVPSTVRWQALTMNLAHNRTVAWFVRFIPAGQPQGG